jgi:hypothetical protein
MKMTNEPSHVRVVLVNGEYVDVHLATPFSLRETRHGERLKGPGEDHRYQAHLDPVPAVGCRVFRNQETLPGHHHPRTWRAIGARQQGQAEEFRRNYQTEIDTAAKSASFCRASDNNLDVALIRPRYEAKLFTKFHVEFGESRALGRRKDEYPGQRARQEDTRYVGGDTQPLRANQRLAPSV